MKHPLHPPKHLDAAQSAAFFLTFRSSFPYKYTHQTDMLTTHAFDGTQTPPRHPATPPPPSCSTSSSRQIGSGGVDLSSSSPGSGVLSSGSRCRGRRGPGVELSGSLQLQTSSRRTDLHQPQSDCERDRESGRGRESESERNGMGWRWGVQREREGERSGSLKNA